MKVFSSFFPSFIFFFLNEKRQFNSPWDCFVFWFMVLIGFNNL